MKPPLRRFEIGVDLDPRTLPKDPLAFLRRLVGPALIRLAGRDRGRTRIVSTLLHGNEPSGLRALLRYLREAYVPATDVLFFVGSVSTALAEPGFAWRALPGTIDANRCWRPPWDSPAGRVAREALEAMRAAEPECLVDLHNNTGHNPAYGVAFGLGPAERELVSLFASLVVHTPLELGTLVEAMLPTCPSVTIECGRAGDPDADDVAWQGLIRFLAEDRIDHAPRLTLATYEDPIRICVRPGFELAFGDEPVAGAALTVSADIDRHNFERVPPGTPIGWVAAGTEWPIEAFDADGRERSRELFAIDDGVLRAVRERIPIMMTTDRLVAASDCLFYSVRLAGESDPPASVVSDRAGSSD